MKLIKSFCGVFFVLAIFSVLSNAQNECPTVNPNTQAITSFNVADSSGVRHQNLCADNTNGRLVIPNMGASGYSIANAASTGTTNFTVTKLTGAPSTALIAATTDNKNSAIVGITVNNAGTTGNATIANTGIVPCIFDSGGNTAGNFVTVSTTTAGNCKDFGSSAPTDGSIILGRSTSTNAGTGTYNIVMGATTTSNVSSLSQSNVLGVTCGTIAAGGACANTSTGTTFHAISGIATLSGNTSTITGISPAFTSSSSFFCVANDITTRANPVQAIPASGTTVTFTNTTGATDNIQFICIGS